MPKTRETCTRCSMRRQRCDKGQPCSRCIDAGEADSCTRVWAGGYNAKLHRVYPRPKDGGSKRRLRQQSCDDAQSYTDTTARISSRQSSIAGSSAGNMSESEQQRPMESGIADSDLSPFPDVMDATSSYFRDFSIGGDSGAAEDHPSFKPRKLFRLQKMFPAHTQLLQLIEYHEACLLWLHNCIHGPAFRQEVATELHKGNDCIRLDQVDLRWAALLFAVLSATIVCAPESHIRRWNLTQDQRHRLNSEWYEAAVECLALGDFDSNPHICSVQTIQILGLSAHPAGLSNRQFVMHGTALRIAQSLGLHRLPNSPDGADTAIAESARISTELGRRIWWNLVMTDWFSIPTYDSFCVQPSHWTTSRLRPYVTSGSSRELAEAEAYPELMNHEIPIAIIMVDFHIATLSCNDTTAKYAQVLKYDAKIREAAEKPFQAWERGVPWASWAGHDLRIMRAHKILMVHRYFLNKSFNDNAFSFSRWASVEASKVIVQEVEMSLDDPNRPRIWQEQACVIGAGVTLCLDAMHRSSTEPQYHEHRNLADKALLLLDMCDDSVLASRGYRLLSGMLKEVTGSPAKSPYRIPKALVEANQELSLAWPEEQQEMMSYKHENDDIMQLPTPEEVWEPMPGPAPLNDEAFLAAATTAMMQSAVSAPLSPCPMAPHGGHNVDYMLGDTSWTNMISDFFPDQLGAGDPIVFERNIYPQLPQ